MSGMGRDVTEGILNMAAFSGCSPPLFWCLRIQLRIIRVEALSNVLMSFAYGCPDLLLRLWLAASQFFVVGQQYSQHPNYFPYHILVLWVTVY